MKRIFLLTILILITGIMFSCNDSSNSKTEEGYIDPGLTAKTVSTTKSYNLTMTTGGNKTASGSGAYAIIYQGELNKIDYVGIAIDNFDNTPTTDRFKLQIYWQASSINSVSLTSSQYTVKLIINDVEYTTPTGNLDLTITPESDGTYSIEINTPITLTSNTITGSGAPDIRAQKY